MNLNSLFAISPVDGRYWSKASDLSPYFSEFGLIRYRLMVEVEYFIALVELPLPQLTGVHAGLFEKMREIYQNFTPEEAEQIKDIEKTTNHDVKAVEYFLKEKFQALGLTDSIEFIHFGLTSQDINNTAIPRSLKDALNEVLKPELDLVLKAILDCSEAWSAIPMLARTHGQPASPTRLGKEFLVFHERLRKQIKLADDVPFSAKFGGATGNFNAHHAAYPEIDWLNFGDNFLDVLELSRSQPTTQIEHYDNLAALFDAYKRINTILIDFCRDVWQYISMGYFKQKIVAGEIGSSAMPHKVNPIDFENAEGNLGIANALFEHMASKLPISRLQRDLTDSTVLRNIGVPLAHSQIAWKSIIKGISKLELHEEIIRHDLEENWAVVAEAIQTVLRKSGYPQPYEALKELTRNHRKIDQQAIHEFIDGLEVDAELRERLKGFSPFNYTGI